MKTSMWSSYFMDLSPEDAILELKKNGYYYTELSDEHAAMLMKRGDPVEVGKAFGEFARANGVGVLQGHLSLSFTICDGGKSIELVKKWLDLFDAIGITSAVLHCDRIRYEENVGVDERIDRNVEALKELCSYIEGREIRICIESCRSDFPLMGSAEEILYIIDRVGSERMGVCLDTGHLNLTSNKDQEKFILTVGDKLTALHIADNDRSGDQHIMPFGMGNVNWTVVMKSLKKIGYDGLFNYEIPGERGCPDCIKSAKLQYLLKVSEYYIQYRIRKKTVRKAVLNKTV